MDIEYINIYNNLINLTRNKKLFIYFTKNDEFSDRLIIFLIHFAFFLKVFKSQVSAKKMQNLYDYVFKQLEISIREIGYGDASINKKMKNYINLFHSMVSEIHFWDNLSETEKINKISLFFENYENIHYLLKYLDEFNSYLSKKTLNSYLKSVINP